MKYLINQLLAGKDLSSAEAQEAMEQITSGEPTPESVAAFLALLQFKGVKVSELVSFVSVLRSKMNKIPSSSTGIIDVCGTGGDGSNTFNISTATAFVAAGAGAVVVKHGNRAVSGKCGSSDVLESLGISRFFSVEQNQRQIEENGLTFLFAPLFHPALKQVAPIRQALGIRTVFNLLGPLLNPAEVKRQVIGVYDPKLTGLIAEALRELGSEEVIVAASPGLDEFSLSQPTSVAQLKNGKIDFFTVVPEDFGLERAKPEELTGGQAEENAAIIKGILAGEIRGAKRDIVLLNTAVALLVAGVASDYREGVKLAAESIDSGAARKKLVKLQEMEPLMVV